VADSELLHSQMTTPHCCRIVRPLVS
jgi:hypothetical protein